MPEGGPPKLYYWEPQTFAKLFVSNTHKHTYAQRRNTALETNYTDGDKVHAKSACYA